MPMILQTSKVQRQKSEGPKYSFLTLDHKTRSFYEVKNEKPANFPQQEYSEKV